MKPGSSVEQPAPPETRREAGAESREKAERTAERLAGLERRVETEPADLEAGAESQLADAVLKSGLTLDECAGSDKVRAAAQELADVRQAAAAAGSRTRQKAAGLAARFRRLVVGGGVALSALTGAMPTRAEAAGPEAPPAAEKVEERPPFEQIKQRALERVASDPELLAALGAGNVEVIRQALELYDAGRINAIAARLAGIDEKRIAGETPVEIDILTEAQADRLEAKDRGLLLDGSGANLFDHVYIMPEKRLDRDGQLTVESVLGTLVHEQIHVAHSPGVTQENSMYESGTTTTVYEGMTEMMNIMVMKELGQDQRVQAYGGGTLATAFLMERVLGQREFARLYFEGDMDSIKEALGRRIGNEAATAVMNTKMGVVSRLLGEAQGMATALELVQGAKLAGLDVNRLADTAGSGLRERITVSDEADLVVLSKDSLKGELDQDIILDTGVRLTPHSFPIRISIDTRHPRQGASVDRAVGRVNARLAKTAEMIEQRYAESYERTHDPEADQFFVARTGTFRDAFHFVLQSPPEIEGLKERYLKAGSPAEKQRIEEEAVQALIAAARDAARQIQAGRLKIK